MIREVNQALDSYESVLENGTQTEKMLELGALLANVRRGREEAYALLAAVPSPNKVPAHLCEEIVGVTKGLFGFIESCQQREKLIQRMAESHERGRFVA